ncbi:DNA gyrase subunit B [Streptomyces sp. NPDC001595]|uniref:DNA gyrase subunit B n=1 Tax=Streptomyces sp. NPDC001532 TaxID=3154520 RepID=UPI0033169912
MSEEADGYDTTRIHVLEGCEAFRKRPGMYVGSIGERGLHQLVFEVADRPVNEVLARRAGRVAVTLTADGRVRVSDDGPGVPVEAAGHAGDDGPGLESLLTRPHSGPGPRGCRVAPLGLFGIGPCVTNALSSRLTAEVRRDGVHWVQEYACGVPITPPTAVGPATGSGTTLTFRPDADIFETTEFSYTALAERFRELAFLNRALDLTLTDERAPGGRAPAGPRSERFHFPGGARDFVAFLDAASGTPLHRDVIGFERTAPRIGGTAEVALRWCASRAEQVRTFVNSLATDGGGTHLAGFRDGLAATVDAYARRRGLLSPAEPGLGAERMSEGLTAVVSVKMDRPEFEGATRATLSSAAAGVCVGEAVREGLGRWLEEHPEQAVAVIGRFLGRPPSVV